MKQLIITILLSLSAFMAQSQINYAIDSTEMMIGDQVTLTITGATDYPTIEQLSQNNIEVIRQWIDSADDKSGTLQYKYQLTCFEEGEHWLLLTENDSVLLTVNDVANVDTTNATLRDIAEVIKEPVTFKEVLPWIALAIVVAVLAYVLTSIIKKKPLITLPQAPVIPPHEIALAQLEKLRERQLWQNGMIKQYHTELTDIVRNYIELVCHVSVTDMTTDQTIEAMHEKFPKETAIHESLSQILHTADMVKFAKSEPLPHEHDNSMTQAVSVVKAIHELLSIPKQQKEEVKHE